MLKSGSFDAKLHLISNCMCLYEGIMKMYTDKHEQHP